MTADNYHLKWDSHLNYLNSSVATLYKSEKYADVVLYSSSGPNTVGISAHKFILSSCSQFFSSIFEASHVANNGVFCIVLPPDLSHRAIQILVQYMYVGEATVSNEVLSEVLRGGEILKIRGLCRAASSQTQQQPQRGDPPTASNYNVQRIPLNAGGSTSVRYLMEQQQQQHLRGLGASVMPKDSPVIIKSPKPLTTLAMSSASAVTTSSLTMPSSSCSGMNVKKQVSHDAIDKCCPKTELVEQQTSMCTEIGCSCSRVVETAQQQQQQQIIVRRERRQSDDPTVLCRTASACQEICNERDLIRIAGNTNECMSRAAAAEVEDERSQQQIYDHELRRSSLPTDHMETEYAPIAESYNFNNLAHASHIKQMKEEREAPISAACTSPPSLPLETKQFVKEEPKDWLPVSSIRHPRIVETKMPTVHIKTEVTAPPESVITTSQTSLPQHTCKKEFERFFKCDICSDTFEDKSALVRHLDSHASTSSGFSKSSSNLAATGSIAAASHDAPSSSSQTKQYVPKKRRRISQETNQDHVCLQCDLCGTSFETPAEWVRHMNNQHTEVELALFNNKKDKEKNNPAASTSHKKLISHQRHLSQNPSTSQRSQAPNDCTNNPSSVLCQSPHLSRHDNNTDYLRSTLSPA